MPNAAKTPAQQAPEAIAIVAARRTPMGSFQGELSPLTAADLGGAAIRACIEDSGVNPEDIDDVFMGCVLTAGQVRPLLPAACRNRFPQPRSTRCVVQVCAPS